MTVHPPTGFEPHTRRSPATSGWEPIFAATGTGVFRLGIVISPAHCNSRGMLHGGVIATLSDNACGLTLGLAHSGGAQGITTTSLAVDYVGAAKVGQWLEIVPRVVKAGRASGVVDALISADGEVIARANASFRIVA